MVFFADAFSNLGIFHNVHLDDLSVNTIALIIANIIQLLLALGAALAVILITYAGVRYATAQGDAGQVKEAKGTITNAIVGLILSSASFLVVDFIARQFDNVNTIHDPNGNGSTAASLGLPAIELGAGMGAIVNVLAIVAGVVSTLFLVIGGIKYASSNGDPAKIKDAKITITNAIAGLIISIMAAAIVSFVLSRTAR